MGAYEAHSQLGKSMKELMASWNETKVSWGDAVSQSFESKYLVALEADLKSALAGLEHISRILQQVHRDCD